MFEYLVNVMPQLISGTGITVKLFALTLIGSIPLGILLAFVLASRLRILKLIVQVYVWLMRGTPLLLQLIFVFLRSADLRIVFDRFEAALIAFIINYAAYFAEIFRGGSNRIPAGQYAAKVLRLSPIQTIQKSSSHKSSRSPCHLSAMKSSILSKTHPSSTSWACQT